MVVFQAMMLLMIVALRPESWLGAICLLVSYYLGEIPVASILGNPQVFIESGSVLNLTCVVKQAITKPAFIIWRHGTKVIYFNKWA